MSRQRNREIELVFRKIPFLVGLSEGERSEVQKHFIFRDFQRNEIILHEADASNSLYLILSGELKAVQISADGKEHILAIHKKGDFFGDMALLDGKTAPATVVALKDCRICLITKAIFSNIIMKNQVVVDGIIDMLCLRLRQAWLKIRVMSFANAEQRIRVVLHELGKQFAVRDSRGLIIALDINHQNIANLSTTSRETATRFLNRAAKAGEIEILANKKILLKSAFFNHLH